MTVDSSCQAAFTVASLNPRHYLLLSNLFSLEHDSTDVFPVRPDKLVNRTLARNQIIQIPIHAIEMRSHLGELILSYASRADTDPSTEWAVPVRTCSSLTHSWVVVDSETLVAISPLTLLDLVLKESMSSVLAFGLALRSLLGSKNEVDGFGVVCFDVVCHYACLDNLLWHCWSKVVVARGY